jgi:hypothetical protein
MAKTLTELRQSTFHQQLGQKMCAAFIAQQQGITLSTAANKVTESVGDRWLIVAEFARLQCTEANDTNEFARMSNMPLM